MTPQVIAQACGCTVMRAQNWAASLAEACAMFGVDTPRRQAAFLAQIAHESGRLQYVRELWGPTPTQTRYEGRADLGNTQPGDGFRYRGRGLIQTTGRANYAGTRDGLRKALPGVDVPDFIAQPDLLEAPRWAALSAGWYWQSRGLNRWADSGTDADFETLTRRINGGLNGLDDRRKLWIGARAALGA